MKARENIARDFHIAAPFASENVLSDRRPRWVYVQDALVRTGGRKQTNIIELFAKEKLDFGSDGLSKRFYPSRRNYHSSDWEYIVDKTFQEKHPFAFLLKSVGKPQRM